MWVTKSAYARKIIALCRRRGLWPHANLTLYVAEKS